MLRNKYRAVSSKQALMADQTWFLSATKHPSSPISSFSASPRFFNGVLSKNLVNSPNFVNPERNLSKHPETEAIGLALIDSIIGENGNDGKVCKPISRIALFGSKLKVQIPITPVESPKSPADFGIKTRNSQLLSPLSSSPAKDFARQLSLKEMELSEDYTCVITHGPNPKTTHIYDDCIVGSDNDDMISDQNIKDSGFESPDFIGFCHTCKHVLGQDTDICIYRGEKVFDSQECRCKGIISEGTKNPRLDDAF